MPIFAFRESARGRDEADRLARPLRSPKREARRQRAACLGPCSCADGRPLSSVRAALEAIGKLDDDEIDLADAAFQLARIDAPPQTWDAARVHLTELAREAARLDVGPDDLLGQAEALAILLVERHGYLGDRETYDDRANANLIRVVERRRGLPVALGILWLHAARAAGWEGHGLDMPGHFLIALGSTQRRLALDPFAGGSPASDDDLRRLIRNALGPDAEPLAHHVSPMTDRAILLRLQNNILIRRLRAGEIAGAIACAEDMRRIAPLQARAIDARIAELRARLN